MKMRSLIRYVWLTLMLLVVTACMGPDRSHRLVVIDAGHGGHDCGAQCGGKQEKEVVMQLVQKLYKEFKREGYRVYLTRGSDRFLTLGERTRIADRRMRMSSSPSMPLRSPTRAVLKWWRG
jgi:N-acetylmuramoyl-L-alanine amidase